MPRSRRFPTRLWMWITDSQVRLSLTATDDPFTDEEKEERAEYGGEFAVRKIVPVVIDTHEMFADLDIRRAGTVLRFDDPVLTLGHEMSSALRAYTALARLFVACDPARHGLVVRRAPHDGRGSLIDDIVGYRAGRYPPSDLPAEWTDNGYAWFAPHGDPDEFGTPYLMPLTEYDWEYEDETGDEFGAHKQYWGLFQVGLNEPLSLVGWAEVDAFKVLVEQVLDRDLDNVMVLRSLATDDLEELRDARNSHAYRMSRLAAQEAWKPEYAIRPTVTYRAIRDGLAPLGLYAQRYLASEGCYVPWARHESAVRLVKVDLRYSDRPTGRGRDFKTVEAGREINLPYRLTAKQRTRAVTRITKVVAEHQLGVLYEVRGENDRLLLVGNEDFFLAHLPAFGVEGDETISRLDPPASGRRRAA